MRNLWIIFWREYRSRVFTRRFLTSVFGMPLLMLGISLLSGVVAVLMMDRRPIGVVDQAGILQTLEDPRSFTPYPSQAEAQSALQDGKIQAYYLIPGEYASAPVQLIFSKDQPDSDLQTKFLRQYQRAVWVASGIPASNANRASLPTVFITDLQPTGDDNAPLVLLPLFVAFMLIFAVISTAGYALYLVVQEKENRTAEVLLTSVSADLLFNAKVLAVAAMGLTLTAIWGVGIAGALALALRFFPQIAGWLPSAGFWLRTFGMFSATFLLLCALMALLGATVTQASEGQQMMGLLVQPIFLPLYFLQRILEHPDSLLVRVFSFLPFTNLLTNLLRDSARPLPNAEWGLLLLIQWGITLGGLWLAGRAFRVGMLSYGKRLSLWQILRAKEALG